MNDIKAKILEYAADGDLRDVSIRELGRKVAINGKDVHPQTIKYHWKKLYSSGDLPYLYHSHTSKSDPVKNVDTDSFPDGAVLVKIPVYGSADCGPATKVAEEQDLGYIRVSSRILNTRRYESLYAVVASGPSMNRANIHGHAINDGDYVVVDRSRMTPRNGEPVVAIVDGLANIKKFYREHDRIVLVSDSSEQFDPIFIHPEDQSDNLIGGTVIQVVEKPKQLK